MVRDKVRLISVIPPLQIGMIHRGEVDLGVSSFFANRDRAEAVDFSPILGYAE